MRAGVHEMATAANKNAICNTGFVVGREAVAVIDPGGSLADGLALRDAIRARTSLPIRHVIVTHIHPDHILGSPAFAQDHPEFIGHAALPQAIAERGAFYAKGMHDLLGDQGGAAIVPDRTVSSTATVDLGGRQLEIQARGRGHSGSDLTVMDLSTSTFWAADLLFVSAYSIARRLAARLAQRAGGDQENQGGARGAGTWAGLGALAGGRGGRGALS